jgi:hypothetical protein
VLIAFYRELGGAIVGNRIPVGRQLKHGHVSVFGSSIETAQLMREFLVRGGEMKIGGRLARPRRAFQKIIQTNVEHSPLELNSFLSALNSTVGPTAQKRGQPSKSSEAFFLKAIVEAYNFRRPIRYGKITCREGYRGIFVVKNSDTDWALSYLVHQRRADRPILLPDQQHVADLLHPLNHEAG